VALLAMPTQPAVWRMRLADMEATEGTASLSLVRPTPAVVVRATLGRNPFSLPYLVWEWPHKTRQPVDCEGDFC